jgi:hypothetical protein
MIGKIDGRIFPERSSSLPPRPQKGAGPEFHSLLKEKIEESAPLEKMALEFLKSSLALALSDMKPEETDPFLSSSLFLPLNTPVPPRMDYPSEPAQVELDLEMSNYLPRDQNFESLVEVAGQKYGVDPSLIKAVIQVESGGYPLAVSKAGAKGLMQLMPGTAAELGVMNPFDPAENIMAGTRYLRNLLDRYRGDVKLALAAYNWGMGNLEKHPEAMPRETKNYIFQVENLQRNYSRV